MAMELWWWRVASSPWLWLSPGAAWFVFFNLLVGAIVVMSARGQAGTGGHAAATHRRLSRTASTLVMESLRSISLFAFHSGDYCVVSPLERHAQNGQFYAFPEVEAQEVTMMAPPELREPEPAPMSGASGATAATTVPPTVPVAAGAVADVVPVPASWSEKEDEESISLDQAYALACAWRQTPAVVAAAADTTAMVTEIVKRHMRACGPGAEEVEGKAEVNTRAERFIHQFWEELKLERSNSILNYTDTLRCRSGVVTGGAQDNSDRLV